MTDSKNILMKSTIKHFSVLLALVFLILSSSGCSQTTDTPLSKTGFYLNTIITITLYDTNQYELLNQGMKLCQAYDRLFSKTDKNSEIYAINHSDGQPVTVSDETIYLIEKGIEYADKTSGYFNIAIGSVSSLWDFTGDSHTIPSEESLKNALAFTDYTLIELSGNAVTIPKGMQLDLGGIAKGYIGDQLKEFYIENGVTSALLNLGGNIVCIGTPPEKDSFHIGIKKPFTENETITSVHVKDKCVVTSGIYERYFEKENNLYHHILNPDTGYPVKTDLYGITIITDNSMEADILSTTCLILGARQAKEFLKNYKNVEAVFVDYQYNVSYFSN